MTVLDCVFKNEMNLKSDLSDKKEIPMQKWKKEEYQRWQTSNMDDLRLA